MRTGGGATAVGRGASHSRPATSFFWFTNPWKSFKYIIWKNYKWQILGVFLLLLLGLLIFVFIYTAPASLMQGIVKL